MTLQGGQFEKLQSFLTTGFDEDSLEEMVKHKLSKDLFKHVERGTLNKVAFDLLGWAEREGWTETLVQAIYLARPGRPDIRAFVETNWPEMSDLREPGEQARTATENLSALRDKVRQLNSVSTRVLQSGLRRDLQAIHTRVESLREFSSLFDRLVGISTRFRRTITDALDAYRSDGARDRIEQAVQDLQAEVGRLREVARRLHARRVENVWIDSLEQAAAFLRRGLSATGGGTLDSGVRILLRVASEEPPQVTLRLFEAAGALDLQELCSVVIELCDDLAGIAADQPGQFPLHELQAALRPLLSLDARLCALVDRYFEWQWVDKECAMAEELAARAPAERFPRWDDFRERVDRLCTVGGGRAWANTLADLLKELTLAWTKGEPTQFDGCYDQFRTTVVGHFLNLNVQLSDLIEQLVEVASPLHQLLELMPPNTDGASPPSGERG